MKHSTKDIIYLQTKIIVAPSEGINLVFELDNLLLCCYYCKSSGVIKKKESIYFIIIKGKQKYNKQ